MNDSVIIPGYQIERQLGHGGMAKVYLAVQESVQRRVALKVMSQVLLVDDAFSERFVREARIAANLTHPHIVAVHDVGVHDVHHYIAMEYLPGGDLAHECSQGVEQSMALRVTKEIASALEYAHRKGFVHRDVKPENILFRENATAVLSDFGIARAVNSATQMTKTGAVIGTPQYMSPEQARGKDLDGRSDLYSLGVVFYEMLTGAVPYAGTDWVAVGIKHVTEPVPKLPSNMSHIQPVLERFLAKNSEQRYATGGEAFVDLQRLEERLAQKPMSAARETAATETAVMPTMGRRATDRIDADSAGSIDGSGGSSTGPQLGSIDSVSIDADLRRHHRRRKPRSFGGGLLLLLVLAGGAAAWFWRDQLPLQEWMATLGFGDHASVAVEQTAQPSQPQEIVDDQGPTAVAEVELGGTIRRDPVTPNRQTQAAMPKQIAADQIAAISEQFATAITDGRLDDAQVGLEQLRLLNPADPSLGQRQDQLDQARAAQAAELALQQEAEQAAEEAQRQATKEAAERQRLADARQQRIEQLLLDAKSAAAAGRWSAPADNSAADLYRQVLTLNPNNPHAQRGLQDVAKHYIGQAETALEADELERVGDLIKKIQEVAPDAQALTQIRRRLRLYRQQRERNQVSDTDQAQIQTLLSSAQQAMTEGRLMEPPGQSAWDQLKAVLRLDPNSVTAREQLTVLATNLSNQARRSLDAGQLESAMLRISQVRQVDPGHQALSALDQAAASRAIAAADMALSEGRLDDAARWLDQAERLRPGLPQLEQLHLKLNIARETG